MGAIAIGSRQLSKNDPDYQAWLKKAYDAKRRPKCTCRQPGPSMYIAQNGQRYIVKRMPGTGDQHHPNCSSYEVPAQLSGFGEIKDKALSEDETTGLTTLKLGFSLSKLPGRKAPQAKPGEQTTVKTQGAKFGLRSLLHYLYEEARLNHWSPRMKGKRNWYVVRKNLLIAAGNKSAKQSSLLSRLFIPETFRPDDKTAISQRYNEKMKPFFPREGRQELGILIGEVKALGEARFGYKLLIKHLPDSPFFIDADLHKSIQRHFEDVLSLWNERHQDLRLLTIATFYVSVNGAPHIESLSLMLVDQRWLPIENAHDITLNDLLVEKNRFFIKTLRYNLVSDKALASIVLTDVGETPFALYSLPPYVTDTYKEAVELLRKTAAEPSVVIDMAESTDPELPAPKKVLMIPQN